MKGQGRIFQRRKPGGGFYAGHAVAWSINGREHREAVGCACAPGRRTCHLADALLLKRRAARSRGPIEIEEERLTVGDALDGHLAYLRDAVQEHAVAESAVRHVVSRYRVLRPHFGHFRVLELRPEHVSAYKTARLAMQAHNRAPGVTISRGTVAVELRTLRAALNRLRKEGRLLHVPYVSVPAQGPPRQGYLEPEIFSRLLPLIADAPGEDPALYRTAIEYAYLSGSRYGEVTGLVWAHVFLRDGEVRLPTTKNGHPRRLALEGRLRDLIEDRWRRRDMVSPYVFHRGGQRLASALRRHFTAAGAALGLHVIPHDCRRSAVRNLERAEVPKTTAMSITGHRSRAVHEDYNATSVADQRHAIRAVDAYIAGRTVIGQR